MAMDQNRTAPERYQNNVKPEWLKEETIPVMNTESPLIRQYGESNER